MAVVGPLAVGSWQDDAIYLATAQSLAAGDGYRHAEIPGEPLQTKYPVLYPALLAVLLKIAPEYPGNVPLLLVPTALAAAALVVLSALYWERISDGAPRELLALGALAALSPAILSMLRFTMSDLLYAGLAVAALWLIDDTDRAKAGGGPMGPPLGRTVGASALIGASILTRSIGITLAVGSLLFLCWRRRWRDAAVLGALVALCVSPWLVWQAWATTANDALLGASPVRTLLVSELSYGVWSPTTLGDVVRVVWQNVFHVAFGLLYFQLGLPESFGMQALAAWSWRTALLHAASWAALLSVAVGFASRARERPAAVHFCALPYAAVVLAYPGDPYRFLLPSAPFLLFFLFRGVARAGRRASAALFAVLVLAFAVEAGRIATSDEDVFHFRVTPQDWRDARQLEEKILELTGPFDVIASGDFAALFLATGRQGYYAWPILDPYSLFYGPDRSWWSFYIHGGEQGAAAVEDQVNRLLEPAYRAGHVTWVVDNARPNALTGAVRSFMARHGEWFQPRYLTTRGMFRIYRVELPRSRAERGTGGTNDEVRPLGFGAQPLGPPARDRWVTPPASALRRSGA